MILEVHKPDLGDFPRPSQKMADEYRQKLNPSIVALWEKVGFCSFENGLFWLVNPTEWESSVQEFPFSQTASAIPILRGSFGSIVVVLSDGSIGEINALLGNFSDVTFNLDVYFLGPMRMNGYCDDAFVEKLHKKAFKKLGRIKSDECYGFEPLLSLGGPEDTEHMVRVKAREHLSLIAQTI